MKGSIKGKWAVVTGATSGIGKATACLLSQHGCNVIITGRRAERISALRDELKTQYGTEVLDYCFDVRNRQACQMMADDLSKRGIVPHVLINNAGLAAGKCKIYEGDTEDWERMIDTNIKGLLYMTRCLLPAMVAQGKGHIILIGSTAGHIVYPEGNVYHATKFAVKALNEAINLDLAGTRIRCCSIDPGAAETEFSLVRFHGDAEKAKQVYEGYTPLKAEDIADVILYVLQTPPHVNITNVVMYPTAQRSVYVWDKSGLI
ncbi:MAG: SDR family NAD(P)-dependent oxidoreductase [Chitinophagales bacterium]|nr:SDR family NAD(P)-dependent oxidoreductase [Chitinophagales bacterium]MDW8418880.1 SDR family NAD(P)-dependent oxidoreductase [Chitinophagales bacterium]